MNMDKTENSIANSVSLSCECVVKSYKGRKVVSGVSLKVNEGEIVGLLGPNGAGKTTTFYMLVGLVHPDSGKVLLNSTDITNFPMYTRAQMGVAYLPQEPSVFRKLSVRDNILGVLEILPNYKGDRKKQLKRVDELIEDLNLGKVRESIAMTLSGGERRRVEIARALACDPKFILLDEPFAGIDPIVVGDLQSLVKLLSKRGIGVLITDHNVRETLNICERAYILSGGQVLESGDPETIANSEIAKKYYLGDSFRL